MKYLERFKNWVEEKRRIDEIQNLNSGVNHIWQAMRETEFDFKNAALAGVENKADRRGIGWDVLRFERMISNLRTSEDARYAVWHGLHHKYFYMDDPAGKILKMNGFHDYENGFDIPLNFDEDITTQSIVIAAITRKGMIKADELEILPLENFARDHRSQNINIAANLDIPPINMSITYFPLHRRYTKPRDGTLYFRFFVEDHEDGRFAKRAEQYFTDHPHY